MINKFLTKNKLTIIIISLILIVSLPFYINAELKFSQIEDFGNLSIGKFIQYEKLPKSRNYYFKYAKKGNIYNDFIRDAPDGFFKNVGKFYEIKYLAKFDDIIVNFDKQITDTVAIIEAGFSREDIINK